jgi:hypothetical protein
VREECRKREKLKAGKQAEINEGYVFVKKDVCAINELNYAIILRVVLLLYLFPYE